MESELVINSVYEWLENYISFSENYGDNKRIAVRNGLRLLIDEGVFRGYADIRKTLLKEGYVLLPVDTLKRLAVRE